MFIFSVDFGIAQSLQFLREAIFDEECGACILFTDEPTAVIMHWLKNFDQSEFLTHLVFTLEIYGHIIGMFELNNL